MDTNKDDMTEETGEVMGVGMTSPIATIITMKQCMRMDTVKGMTMDIVMAVLTMKKIMRMKID